MQDNYYDGTIFSFEIIDRVIVETYSILKDEPSIFRVLDAIKKRLMLMNAEKQKLLNMMALSYSSEHKNAQATAYRDFVKTVIAGVAIPVEQIEKDIKEKFGIENPYRCV